MMLSRMVFAKEYRSLYALFSRPLDCSSQRLIRVVVFFLLLPFRTSRTLECKPTPLQMVEELSGNEKFRHSISKLEPERRG
jgi:hypothetical protein